MISIKLSLLPILLASCIVYAQNNFWTEDNKTKCKVLNPAPVQNEKVQWKGECRQGYANGFGTALWSVNGVTTQKWIGFFNNGTPTRFKVYHLNASNDELQIYEGNHPSYSSGITQLTYKNFTITANYENNNIIGNAKVEYSDGRLYIGPLSNGTMNGFGYFRYANYDEYLGEFRDGKRSGFGVLYGTFAYKGEWLDDKFHGSGVLVPLPDTPNVGIATIGKWKYGKLHGDDIVMIYPSGINAVGNYHNGKWTNPALAPENSVPMPFIAKIKKPNFDLNFVPIYSK